MTTYWTGDMIKTKVEQDLDLEEETFIVATEMLGYINEAIRECAAEVNGLYEDYFLTKAFLPLVLAQEDYLLPAGIYANKIRRIIYRFGSIVYSIDRLKDWKKFEEYSIEKINQSSLRYRYFLYNPSPTNVTILLSPPSKENSSTNVTIWYLRNPQELMAFSDTCDVPEFVTFIMQFVKVRCYEKEGHPNLPMALSGLEQQRAQMQSTLAAMVPDADNEIEPDMRLYREMS